MKKGIFVLVLLAVCGSSLVAAPLNRARVSAEATWVLHADYEKFLQTTIGKLVREEVRTMGIDEKLQAFAQIFSFNPLSDIKNVTLYGKGKDPQKGVALIQGQFNPDTLTALVTMNPYYENTAYGSHRIHSWIDEKHGVDGQRQYGAFFGADTVAISMGKETLQHVLDVLDGKLASQKYNYDLADFEQSHQGIFLLVAAQTVNESLQGVDDGSGLIQHTDRFALAMGEDDASTYVDLTLQAVDMDAGTKVFQVLQGLKAFVTLSTTNEAPKLAKIAEAIEIASDNDVVLVHLDWDSKDLFSILKELAEQAQIKNAEQVSKFMK
ncbi:MAG: hypothetical protein JW828_10515 [Sedimentisphaerales bacterium]|nr:hypothetical protein [Sedimentisphaerales bacterium]